MSEPLHFRSYLLATAVSTLGSRLSSVTLPLLVFDRTGSALQTTTAIVISTGPFLFFGFLAGVAADKFERSRTLVLTSVLSAALTCASAILTATPELLPLVFLTMFASSTAAVFFDAAAFGSVRKLVGPDGLVRANSALSVIATTSNIVAAPVATVLYAAIGPTTIFAVDAASFLFAAAVMLALRKALLEPPAAHVAQARWWPLFTEGLTFLGRHPLVRTITMCGSCNAIAGGAITGLLVVVGAERLHLDLGSVAMGVFLATRPASSVVVGLVLPKVVERYAAPPITQWALLGSAVLMAALAAFGGTYVSAVVLLFVWGLFFDSVSINGISMRGQVVPPELQGRVNTAGRALTLGAMPLGALLAGLVASLTSVTWAIGGMALFALAGFAVAATQRLAAVDIDSHVPEVSAS